jgi:hypothetical protein
MKDNCATIKSRHNQYNASNLIREDLMVYSGCGLVSKSIRTGSGSMKWFVFAVIAMLAAVIWVAAL